MSWPHPSDFENSILEDAKNRWPEIIDLARLLSLAPRIEPLLLRNMRLRFFPRSSAEIESLLWFSPLVILRNTNHIVFYQGTARLLANQLQNDSKLEEVWEFIRRHTLHWEPTDQLERDLRYHALTGNSDMIRSGLRDILKLIHHEQDEKRRIVLARWAKRSLPLLPKLNNEISEMGMLAQYAGLALGDTSEWTNLSQPSALPPGLSAKLPEPFDATRLGFTIHADAAKQGLKFTDSEDAPYQLNLPTPLPAKLHIRPEGGRGEWYTVDEESVVEIESNERLFHLTTIDGKQYNLKLDDTPRPLPPLEPKSAPIYLCYAFGDSKTAKKISRWLKRHNLPIKLIQEKQLDQQTRKGSQQTIKLIRLWTRNAEKYWNNKPESERDSLNQSLLLRIEAGGVPHSARRQANSIDWNDWSKLGDSSQAENILEWLGAWLRGEEIPTDDEPVPDVPEPTDSVDVEINGLLHEIDDPSTLPTRRLQIGDRLAELGDTRPGIGVREIEIPVTQELDEEDTTPETELAPEIRKLLEEINDNETKPPRRLEIGDELDRLGNPRPGVGLDKNGLPDIDWVEIPEGPFIYQDGETLELPTFQLARYPVTNSQFQAFIDDGGYKEKRWWKGLKKPRVNKNKWSQGNRPRTNIDWYEATAFCRWLSEALGYEVRLPTEQEWEKAARGEKGLTYPWGNKFLSGYANINETRGKEGEWYLKQTTAVGLYPQGASPYGLDEMSGNVWEWCRNKYKKPEFIDVDDSGDRRVLRGGSWLFDSDGARAAVRHWSYPDDRNYFIGFRVCSSAPITVR